MNRFTNYSKTWKWLLVSAVAALVAGCGGGGNGGGGGGGGGGPGASAGPTGGTCVGADCVDLGTAANYSILAKAGTTTTGTTVVTGNVGVSPIARGGLSTWDLVTEPTDTYFTSALVAAPGKLYADDNVGGTTKFDLGIAVLNMGTAYNAAAGKTSTAGCPGTAGNGNLGGLTLVPGVYTCAVNVTIPTATTVTLSGSSTDVWVFQITGTLTQAANTQVILTGGALPKNVFWQVSGVVAIEPNAVMQGIILGFDTISMQSGASINGRLLGNTNVTLIANTVTLP